MEHTPIPQEADLRASLREELELRKLTAETEASEANARQAELNLDKARRELSWTLASERENGRYTFIGPVNESSASKLLSDLGAWSLRFPDQPLELVFNSPGGGVIAGMAIYDTILELKNKGHHITTVVRGQASSMGAILLQSGHERVIGRNAYMLVHQLSDSLHGTLGQLEDHLAWLNKIDDQALTILYRRSQLSKSEFRSRWQRKEWWLTAREAVNLGLADRIG